MLKALPIHWFFYPFGNKIVYLKGNKIGVEHLKF